MKPSHHDDNTAISALAISNVSTGIKEKTQSDLDSYIHQVYSRKVTTQDQRRTIASKLNLTKEQVESQETRVKIADYLAKTQDNKYYHYVSKQELFWAMKDVMAGSEIDVQEKTKADALCDKLIVDLDKLAKDIWGDVEKEGRESVTKRTVEDRIKGKSSKPDDGGR